MQKLRHHIEHGDPASDRGAEILPHPWCDFCEEYFFDVNGFKEHLDRMHLPCHLCGEQHRHMYYDNYESLEVHFSRSHFLCPYEQCKQKCYVAFATENELQAHLNIVHSRNTRDEGKVNANALLGFRDDDDDYNDGAAQGG